MNKLKFGITALLAMLLACGRESTEGVSPEIKFVKPANFPEPTYNFANNPVTTAGFELGRKLFYDPRLSRDNTISCGSCHQQGSAFTHHGHDLSHGIDDRLGERNSPAIMNLAFQPYFFWDGGIQLLDLQPIAPIENSVEMDAHLPTILEKVRQVAAYPPLFEKAFGSTAITTDRFLKAISQFQVMCISSNSRFDKYERQEAGGSLSATELEGLAIFRQKCGSCHSGTLFSNFAFKNNGLDTTFNRDKGVARISLNPNDNYKFRVPSLRNVALTAPYMHDGRFYTLAQVLNHYSDGVFDIPSLDPILKQNGRRGIPLSTDEKNKIIAFLQALTDDDFLKDKKLSEQ
jgi:cytochrome c peroxidase